MIAPASPSRAWTVSDLLVWTEAHFRKLGYSTPRLDAELLLAHALACRRIELYTGYHKVVEPGERERYRTLVERRGRGEPVAYLTGAREFHSLLFEVNPAVLIPRPETEHLVEAVVEHLGRATGAEPTAAEEAEPGDEAAETSTSTSVSTSTEETALVGGNAAGEISVAAAPLRFLDLGTGSGNIAVSVLQRLSGVEALAVDASPEALEVARRNARRHGVEGRVQFLAGDLFDALPGDAAPFHAIASNPPYIPPRDHEGLSREVRDFEPRLALVDERGGAEGAGLGFHRAIVLGAGRFLVPGGLLALEVGAGQAQQVVGLFAAAGFTSVDTVTDYGGIPRVVKGLRA